MAIYRIETTIGMNIDEEVQKVFDANGWDVEEYERIDGMVRLTSDLWVEVWDDGKCTTYGYFHTVSADAWDNYKEADDVVANWGDFEIEIVK